MRQAPTIVIGVFITLFLLSCDSRAGLVVAAKQGGADGCTKSTEGETAIALATRTGRDEILALLKEHCGKA